MNGLMHRSQRHRHTVTLSARRMDEEGTSTPIALAVCRLCAAQQLDELRDQHPLDRTERCDGCAAMMGGLYSDRKFFATKRILSCTPDIIAPHSVL
jgi:hypothetical protein